MERLRFRPSQRLHVPEEYEQIFAGKHSAGDAVLLVFVDQAGTGLAQLGISVGKRFGNSAKRHQLKRFVREAFRIHQDQWAAGLRIVVVPRAGTSPTSQEVRDSLVKLVPKAVRKLPKADREGLV